MHENRYSMIESHRNPHILDVFTRIAISHSSQ